MSRHGWLAMIGVAALGCGSSGGAGTTEPLPLSVGVDDTVVPVVASLPGFADGAPRPVAAVVDQHGRQAEFVANELWVVTDDPNELSAVLTRWSGTVIDSIDAGGTAIPGLPAQYLVRFDPPAADGTRLVADLRVLDSGARGALRVSSDAGLRLLAAATRAAATGVPVGVNWVGRGAAFRDRVSNEAPTGQDWGSVAYQPNVFGWPSHAVDAPEGIGVAEAWRLLDVAGRLGNRVRIAILDMGFQPNADFPAGYSFESNVPAVAALGTSNLIGCGGGGLGSCPWHGTEVVSAAMAVPANDFGSAGPAGPIADAHLIFTLYDFFTSIAAVAEASLAGARVINMSYGASIPAALSWSAGPFQLATAAVRGAGVLLFAAAGNDGADVDSQDCFIACWEDTLFTPCENAGVTCIGGLAWNSLDPDPDSNFGHEAVTLWAPFTQWLGPAPDAPDNAARIANGTSFASPFAAGVAALVWAADPSLSADEVADILVHTAHAGHGDRVTRSVDARAAVLAALGEVPPDVHIVAPADGASISRAQVALWLRATADDVEDGTPTVTWASDRDGPLGSGLEVGFYRPSYGTHRITATATDHAGQTATDAIHVTIVNDPPTVTIRAPEQGAHYYASAAIPLLGSGIDPNDGTLPASSLRWYVDTDSAPIAAGASAAVPGSTLAVGPHTIRLVGSDGELTGEASHDIAIDPDPAGDVPPTPVITQPADGARIYADQWDASAGLWYANVQLCGYALDPEDDPFPPAWLAWSIGTDPADLTPLGGSATGCLTARFDVVDVYGTNYTVRLVATDSAGLTGAAEIGITILIVV